MFQQSQSRFRTFPYYINIKSIFTFLYIAKWIIKKADADPRFRTRDSNSDSDFKFEFKEPLGLPDNTACYVDDISIPHTWRTIEPHNNKFL